MLKSSTPSNLTCFRILRRFCTAAFALGKPLTSFSALSKILTSPRSATKTLSSSLSRPLTSARSNSSRSLDPSRLSIARMIGSWASSPIPALASTSLSRRICPMRSSRPTRPNLRMTSSESAITSASASDLADPMISTPDCKNCRQRLAWGSSYRKQGPK